MADRTPAAVLHILPVDTVVVRRSRIGLVGEAIHNSLVPLSGRRRRYHTLRVEARRSRAVDPVSKGQLMQLVACRSVWRTYLFDMMFACLSRV